MSSTLRKLVILAVLGAATIPVLAPQQQSCRGGEPVGVAARWAAWEKRSGGVVSVAAGGETPAVTFPTEALTSRAYIALTPDYTLPYWQWGWVDITEYVRWNPGVNITSGRADESDRVTHSTLRGYLDNRDGRFTRRNAFGAYYPYLTRNTPIWLQVNPGSGFVDRYFGYVNEWPKRWRDSTGNDSYVPFTASGILRRLAQTDVLRSPLFRTMSGVAPGDYVPHAYWSMEDGADATQFASGLASGQPASIGGSVTFAASNDGLAGSSPLPTLATGASVSFPIASYTNTNQWVLQFAINVPASLAAETTVFTADSPGGTVVRWELSLNPNLVFPPALDYRIRGYNSAGTALIDETMVAENDSEAFAFYGNWVMAMLAVYQDGSDVRARLGMASPTRDINTVSNSTAGTHSAITSLRLPTLGSSLNGVGLGHVGLFTDAGFTISLDDLDNAAAMDGWTGEQVHERMTRLCREEGISFHTTGASTVALGPQQSGTLLDVLRDAEKVDGGVLYEYQFGLGYQSLSERYNAPVHLALDQSAGELAGDLRGTDDDQNYRNQWTAARTNGSEATVRDPDFDDADGLFPGGDTYNAETDGQLPHIAGWQVALGTLDEDRWPEIGINLANTPELIASFATMPFGARLTVDNTFSQAGVDQIGAVVEGYTERWNSREWEAAFNTSPSSVYDIAVYDDAVSRFGARTTVLAEDLTDVETDADVDAGTDLWATTASHPGVFPFNVDIGGVTYSCTAIAGTAPDYTLTIVRLGTDKTHTAGATVTVTDTGRYGL